MKRGALSSFGAAKPSVGRERGPQLSDLVELLEWPKNGEGKQVRYIGPIAARGVHKVKVIKRDGSETQITKACLAYNPEIDDRDTEIECPYCDLPSELATFSKIYFSNLIDRALQENPPRDFRVSSKEDKTGYKDINSQSWTPVRVGRTPSSLALRLKKLGERNIVKGPNGQKKAFPINHEKYGIDIDVSFDKNLPAANMYSADRNMDERHTPLSAEEKDYLIWDLDPIYAPEKLEDAKKEAASLEERWFSTNDGDSDDDAEPPKRSRAGKKVAGKSSGRSRSKEDDLLEDDYDEDLLNDDDGDDDTPPRRQSRSSKPQGRNPSRGRRQQDEGNDDDDFLDDEDDGDDDTPPPRKGKSSGRQSQRRGGRAAQDDLLDDDGDDDTPPPRRNPPSRSSGGRSSSASSGNRRKQSREPLDLDDDDIPF